MRSKTRRKLSFSLLVAAVLLILCDLFNVFDSPNESKEINTHFSGGEEAMITATIEHSAPDCLGVAGSEGNTAARPVWKEGDKVKVTVEGVSSVFTVRSISEDGTAKIVGVMPGEGHRFSVQYPYDAPDMKTQTYCSYSLPEGEMLFEATDCILSKEVCLQPLSSVLILRLFNKDEKKAKTVAAIFENGKTFTLECGDGVSLGKTAETATAFCMVVDPCDNIRFSVNVTFADGTTASVETSRTNTFTPGQYLDMPAREIGN